MRFTFTILALGLFSFVLSAQEVVPRVPVYEVFTSSTCGPCRPCNEYLTPIFEDFKEDVVIVKYQMSWPGSGDPYFTSEGQSRRSFYGVNGVPSVFVNSSNVQYTSVTESSIESDLNEGASMQMDLRYLIDIDSQTVRVRARIEALDDFTDGAHRIFIPIVERRTDNNVKTNGESEFLFVFKKMLPEALGEIVIGEVESGTVFEFDTTYVFQGDYRLPPNATDPIDHETEHSVEEFGDLHVVMFMQSLGDKSIYQGAVGEQVFSVANIEREWGSGLVAPASIEEFNRSNGVSIYPNPSNELTFVAVDKRIDVKVIRVRDINGKLVSVSTSRQADGQIVIPTIDLPAGIYVLELNASEGSISKRFAVTH